MVKESNEDEKVKEEKKVNEKENKEKNVGKFWPTITLVPSSKLVCVVKCWDSSNILQSPNLTSLTHEGNQANEEVFSQLVENNHVLWKFDNVPKSQEEKFLHNSLQFYAGLDLRSNPVEEGGNDDIISSLSMWKEFYKKILALCVCTLHGYFFMHEKDVSSCFRLDIFNYVQYFIFVWNKVDISIIGPCNLHSLIVLEWAEDSLAHQVEINLHSC
jgi:hypothetical protein